MKNLLLAAIFAAMTGGAYAAELADLQTAKVSDIMAATAGNAALASVNKAVAVKEAAGYGGLDIELRVAECYSVPHRNLAALDSGYAAMLSVKAGDRFMECQLKKEPRLMYRTPLQSPAVIRRYL